MAGGRDIDANQGDRGTEGAATPNASPEERYRKIFLHSNDAIMIVDLETESFLEVNPAARELLGYDREEFRSMDPEDIHPNDLERVREEFLSQVAEEGSGFTDDLTCLTKDGEEMPTEISGAALDPADDGGEPTRMIAMLRDVSGRVEHRRELEGKVERLNRFASVVSHDLRNPLSIVRGHAELARETGDPEHFDAIEEAVDRMDELTTDLLELTRAGDVIGERTTLDLGTLAREVWRDCELAPATLEVESTGAISADRGRMRELLSNLFENAFAHAGPDVTVRVGAIEAGDASGFYLEDDGDGIPESDRDAVFEWGHTTAADGTGFGLAIVAEIAAAHGWEIDVTDSRAGGARFEIAGT
ncbi:MAG: PAS domain-containing sensor histidine kinase [Haloferacaceae archaeon]